jgi:hypothetical protein
VPAIVIMVSLGAQVPVTAATLRVAADGIDSGSCGAQSPCRSISQAMDNAASGDTIYVGPGNYGDVNGDGSFTGPGDEHADPQAGAGRLPNGVPSGCIVCITKPLNIYSEQGAATTIIVNPAPSTYGSTVLIMSPGVDFGALGQGFTITGGSNTGVAINLFFPVLQGVSVSGNIDISDSYGFAFYGNPDEHIPCSLTVPASPGSADCRFPARILIAHNQAVGNGTGFIVATNYCCFDGPAPIIVRDNVALGAGTGFAVAPLGVDYPNGGPAQNVQLVNNAALGGGIGFHANLPGQVADNTAVGNSGAGFYLTPGGARFANNSAIGNGGPGLIVSLTNFYALVPVLAAATFVPFSGNNFIGNDRDRPTTLLGPYQINPGPSAHCGVLLGIFVPEGFPLNPPPPPLLTLTATGNFWGSRDGPSDSGPADAVRGACDQGSVKTLANPFSNKQFAVGPFP